MCWACGLPFVVSLAAKPLAVYVQGVHIGATWFCPLPLPCVRFSLCLIFTTTSNYVGGGNRCTASSFTVRDCETHCGGQPTWSRCIFTTLYASHLISNVISYWWSSSATKSSLHLAMWLTALEMHDLCSLLVPPVGLNLLFPRLSINCIYVALLYMSHLNIITFELLVVWIDFCLFWVYFIMNSLFILIIYDLTVCLFSPRINESSWCSYLATCSLNHSIPISLLYDQF